MLKSVNDFPILYSNIASLSAKYDEFLAEMDLVKPAIVVLTETWLHPQTPSTLFDIPNYIMYRKDRTFGTLGYGGTAIYIANSFNNVQISSHINENNNIPGESLWVDIKIDETEILLISVYRSNKSTPESDTMLFHKLKEISYSKTTLILGDFNFPNIAWPLNKNQGEKDSNVAPEDIFLSNYKDSSLIQLVNKPTRYRENNEPSLLDYIMTNDETLITEIKYSAPIGKSDHITLLTNIQINCLTKNPTYNLTHKNLHRNYWKADYEAINKFLHTYDFSALINEPSVEQKWQMLKEIINKVSDKYVPYKRSKSKKQTTKPWITRETIHNIKEKRKLWDKYKHSGSEEDHRLYRCKNNQITNEIRQARQQYESSIADGSSKRFYSHIRKQLSSRASTPTTLKVNDHLIDTPADIANCFANQFLAQFITEPNDQPPNMNHHHTNNLFTHIEITPEKVKNVIKNLKNDSAPGPDQISAVFLKNTIDSISFPLSVVMQASLDTGILPLDWISSTVTPIYKKGDKKTASNYRPISLTSIPCKCLERIIVEELLVFLKEEALLPVEQHGFIPGRSVMTNLLVNLKGWTLEFDRGNPVDIIYLDFEKAFDRVPFGRLLLKLEHFGIRDKILVWIKSFLTTRHFRVRIDQDLSTSREVLSGVPQGSVLGPILFILYTSDLPNCAQMEISLYADDTKIYSNPLDGSQQLQTDLNNIFQWTKDWLLTLNINKCNVLHIGKNNPRIPYTIDSTTIAAVNNQIDLGITVSHDLKWEDHILGIVKRANSIIYLVKKSFHNITGDIFIKIYKSFIRPVLEFGFQIWSPYFKKDIELLEKTQRRATKILPVGYYNKPYEERLRLLKLPTLEHRRLRGDLIETFKILSNKYSLPNMSQIFTMNHNNLRGHHLKLSKNRFRTNPGKNLISNRVVDLWNGLPEDVIKAEDLNQFKNRLDLIIGPGY
jgi:Reverse transcriptase (RNA-dependent DNA polymerase)/Endonuclease-reverse transcriptase